MGKTEINNLIEIIRTRDSTSLTYQRALSTLLDYAAPPIGIVTAIYIHKIQDPAISRDDLVQICNAAIIKDVKKFNPLKNVQWTTWVSVIAHNKCRDVVRAGPMAMMGHIHNSTSSVTRTNHCRDMGHIAPVRLDDPNADAEIRTSDNTELAIYTREMIGLLMDNDLIPEEREIFKKYNDMGCPTYRVVATTLGIPTSRVATIMATVKTKARARLRQEVIHLIGNMG